MQNGIQRNYEHTYGRNCSAGNDTICMYAELKSADAQMASRAITDAKLRL